MSDRKETVITRKFIDKEFSLASEASRWVKDSFGFNASAQIIRRVLKKNDLNSRSKKKNPILHLSKQKHD